ncbi:MAG: penicillin-binding transpeptidase domain-containing protein, partial [bacterium]
VLDLDPIRLARRLTERDRFTYLARWVEPDRARRIRELELPGIGIDPEPRRSYPAGRLAAPLIGFANIDGEGVRGIEQLEDAWLRGSPRRVRVERDARGRALALRSTNPREAQGGEIALTLDAAMQGAAEAALQEAVEAHGARGGTIITLDPETGDVLALAEAPGFDPNRFRELDYAETRARAFTDLVEAGSTMKVFLVASALDADRIDPDTELDTGEGWLRVRGKTIRDARAHGVLEPAGVLRVSSNVGAVQIAQRLGRERQHRGLRRFGFGDATGSGFPTEAAGIVRDWSRWKPVDQATAAFGQGVSVTAIQLAAALAALAHDGERMQPRLVRARRRSAGSWQYTEPRSLGRAVSPDAARRTLDMMRTVVGPEGTGRLAGLKAVPVAGKTGTAQKLDREQGRYSEDRYIAWFMGVVPADDPELAIVVAIDEPSGALHTGGSVAAPLFARVAAAQLGRRGIVTEPMPIPPAPAQRLAGADPAEALDAAEAADVTEASAAPSPASLRSQEPPLLAAVAAPPARPAAPVAAGPSSPAAATLRLAPGNVLDPAFVPDFSGQTIERALRLARAESLVLQIAGARTGRVVSQFPVPGTVLAGRDRTVRLELAPIREEG